MVPKETTENEGLKRSVHGREPNTDPNFQAYISYDSFLDHHRQDEFSTTSPWFYARTTPRNASWT